VKNYKLYKEFQSFFELQGLLKLSEYYAKRADEEMAHHNWIYSYLVDADIAVNYVADENSEPKVTTVLEPFIQTVKREIETTQMLYKIYETALACKDYMTASWLFKQLIAEQIEEENTSRMAQTIMENDGDIFIKSEEVLSLLK
jgi:ferritin